MPRLALLLALLASTASGFLVTFEP